MKILVTGGAGFIASHIVDAYISAGHDVVIIDDMSKGQQRNINPKAKFVKMGVQDKSLIELFEEERFDVINHHAAQMDVRISVENPVFDADVNIIGGINLFESAKRTDVKKIIFASSGGTVYGEQDYFPADEKHPTGPISPYGISKLTSEHYLNYYSLIHGVKFVAFRYANIYGPRQNPYGEAGVVAIFAKKMLMNEEPIINGNGEKTRDYVFVGDVVKANLLALENDFEGIYNIGTAQETDVNYLFRKINEYVGNNTPEVHGPDKKGEQIRSVLSYDKIREDHKWIPSVNIDQGLMQTVEWFKENLK